MIDNQLLEKALSGEKDAFKDLKSFANSGNAKAQYYLAKYYAAKSEETDLSKNEGFMYWMQKAADKGDADAERELQPYMLSVKPAASEQKTRKSTFGRMGRTNYVLTVLPIIGIQHMINMGMPTEDDQLNILLFVVMVVLQILGWIQGIRRCHDIGHSGWWQFIPFYIIWLCIAPGDDTDNEYGKKP